MWQELKIKILIVHSDHCMHLFPIQENSEEQAKRSKRFTDRNLPTEGRNTRNKKGDFAPMRYPEIMNSKQDKLKIHMISFNPRSLSNQVALDLQIETYQIQKIL